MSRYRDSSDQQNLAKIISNLRTRVSKVERAPQMTHSTVSVGQELDILGNFRIFDATGTVIFEGGVNLGVTNTVVSYMGRGHADQVFIDGGSPYGATAVMVFQDRDPQPRPDFPDLTDSGQRLWGLCENGGFVFAEDIDGFYMALPQIPYDYTPSVNYSTPTVSTSSGSYSAQWTVSGEYTNAKLRVLVLVQTSDGTTGGDMQLRDPTSNSIYATDTISNGDFSFHYLTAVFPISGYAPYFKWDLEVRRTAGAGSIRTQVVYATGYGDL